MLTAMARELVENKGIGESADTVWRSLQQLRPSAGSSSHEESEDRPIEPAEGEVPAMLPLLIESIPVAALVKSGSLPPGSSRKATVSSQLSLF